MTTPASRVTAEKSEAAALSDERLWLVTAGPDGEVSQIAIGFDVMMDAVVRCIWEDPSGEEGADQMRQEMADPDFWSGDFWSCQWAFEDGYLQVQRITDASALRSVPPDSVSATPTLSVEGIVREIEVLLDNCHVVEGIDIAAQHEAVMVLVRSLSDSVSDGSKGVRLDGPELWEIVFGIMKGDVPEELTEDVLSQVAAAVNQSLALDSGTGGQQPVVGKFVHQKSAIDALNDQFYADEEPSPTEPKAGVVTDDMVERFDEAFYGRHERGFIMRPLISDENGRRDTRAALTAALNGDKP